MDGIFEKVSKVKNLIRNVFPDVGDSELINLIRAVAKWHYSKKKWILSSEEAKLYEVLINNSYNPDTVYKWLLLTKSPFELKEKLRLKLVTQREAFTEKKELNSMKSATHQELLQDIIQCVERYIVR